jgi:hypothetical protein
MMQLDLEHRPLVPRFGRRLLRTIPALCWPVAQKPSGLVPGQLDMIRFSSIALISAPRAFAGGSIFRRSICSPTQWLARWRSVVPCRHVKSEQTALPSGLTGDGFQDNLTGGRCEKYSVLTHIVTPVIGSEGYLSRGSARTLAPSADYDRPWTLAPSLQSFAGG